jgi:hypothetical protein
MQKTYENIESIAGPILVVDGVEGVKYEELVEVTTSTGEKRMGKGETKMQPTHSVIDSRNPIALGSANPRANVKSHTNAPEI